MNRSASMLVALLAAAASVAACAKDTKRGTDGGTLADGGAASAAQGPFGGASGSSDAGLDAGDGGDAGAVKDAGPDAAAIEDALPSATTPDLATRARHLLEAIVQDNADLASDFVFPRDAYSIAKDGEDPGKAWERKLLPAYQRDVHTAHKKLKGETAAIFVDFEIGHTLTQITPHRKDWTRPLWRVKHSKLTFTVAGKTEHLDIAEMVAWRGAWYVVKLR